MAYTNSPSTLSRDAVRLLVGDISTSTASEWLADTDYTFFLANTPNIYIAAQLASNSLAALFGSGDNSVSRKKVGDLEIESGEKAAVAEHYRALAQKYGRMAAAQIVPSAGGISASEKAAAEADSDRVPPFFKRNAFDASPTLMVST